MSSLPASTVSLYQLVRDVEQPPSSLQTGPKTFRSLLRAVLKTINSQPSQATIWVKLPRRQSWQEAFDRYLQEAELPHQVYRLERDDSVVDPVPHPVSSSKRGTQNSTLPFGSGDVLADLDELALVSDAGMITSTDVHLPQNLTIPLTSNQHLNQEYFLLVLAQTFSGLFLAHRPRSVKSSQANGQILEEPLPETDNKRSPLLLTLCSFEAPVLQKALQGLREVVRASAQQYPTQSELDYLLSTWDEQFTHRLVAQPNPAVLSQLFVHQLHQQNMTLAQMQQQEQQRHPSLADQPESDVTAALRVQNEELMNVIRLKDEFLNQIGQELRTPLTNMKTALTLLNSPNIKTPQRQRYMDMISRECDRQSSLISGVLDLLQLEHTDHQQDTQSFNLIDIVPGVVSTYQPLAKEKGVLLAYTIPNDLPHVSCPPTWLRQIVINLLHNGIRFTSSGGQVWVKGKRQGDRVVLEVQDTGTGISSMDLSKIFEPFYRGRQPDGESSEGAGLGLTIVQQLLVRCGGSITVVSEPGQGSNFSISLPIARS